MTMSIDESLVMRSRLVGSDPATVSLDECIGDSSSNAKTERLTDEKPIVSRYQPRLLPRSTSVRWQRSYIDELVSLNSSFSTPRTTLTFFVFGSDLFRILRRSTRDVTACLSMAVTKSPFRKPSPFSRLPAPPFI